MSTVRYSPCRTCPSEDAAALHGAINNAFWCDKAQVVNILAHRDATQRALILQEYRRMFSCDFLTGLSSKLGDDLGMAVRLWMHDPGGRDAIVVQEALSSRTKNLRFATGVICSRTPYQMQSLKRQYLSTFEVSLEYDIEMQTSGEHKELLLAYVSTLRDEGPEYDRGRAAEDSNSLFQAGVGTDAETFINIFSERSRAQLAAVISAYHDIYGNSLEKAVQEKTDGLFEYALLTILSCSKNPARYFAEVLREAMKRWGTDDATLIRVIVTRSEIDMQHIKDEYLRKYKKTLNDAVYSETSSHYRRFLLFLLGPNN